jgi:Tfp pilus assembly protein FimT
MKPMRGFALLELLVIVFILGLLALLFVGASRASLFTPGTASQAQEGQNAIQQAREVTQQFNSAANREQSSTDQVQ